MEMNQAPGDASLTQSPRFRGPGIAWRREAPLALRGLRSPTESPPGGSPGPSVREAWLGYTTGAVRFASMGFQNGRRSPNVLGQRCYSVLQSIGKPFWFPIDWRTTIQLFSQRTWETLRMPSSHRFENHSVFKSLGERQDNTFPERSTTPTVLEATLYIDLLTFGAFKSQRTCTGLPEGSLHCLPPHRLAELYREPMEKTQ
ncbi:hypothetical protein PCASD_01392 [Puccinia coronata f. sp. avenae]|uniref:Uncharacterized protein n=1 Tax=Puccinia coronata f. sp. avenae TaxID=200324 RepID=A0A2N5VKL0_9BASI|nr:hypothetical protein PCASD_01392 [Puccinia coronata f. sp. avenae]